MDDRTLLDRFGGGDPSIDPKEGEFEKHEDGEYLVNGIDAWFSTDEQGLPVFVPGIGPEMVARCNLKLVGSGDGPPMSGTRTELVLLAKALGASEADLSALPQESSTAFLLSVQKIANAGGKSVKAVVKGGKGWVRYVEGTQPLPGLYTYRVEGFRSPDRTEPVRFQEQTGTFNGKEIVSEVAFLTLSVVGDVAGRSTVYNGYTFDVRVRNPFSGESLSSSDGRTVPSVKRAANGGSLIDARRFLHFVSIVWPEIAEYNWQGDAEASSYGVNELIDPLVVVADKAVRSKVRLVGALEFSPGGFPKLDLLQLYPAGNSPEAVVDVNADMENPDSSELLQLVTTIEAIAPTKVFEDTAPGSSHLNLIFTEAGKQFARDHIGPAWERLGLPVGENGRQIASLIPLDMLRLKDELERVNPSKAGFATF